MEEYKFLNDIADWFCPSVDDYALKAHEYREYKTEVLDEFELLKTALGNRDQKGTIRHALKLNSILQSYHILVGVDSPLREDQRMMLAYALNEVIEKRMELHE